VVVLERRTSWSLDADSAEAAMIVGAIVLDAARGSSMSWPDTECRAMEALQ